MGKRFLQGEALMPKLDVLLHGYRMNTQQGIVGFCSIILIEGQKRTLVDVGHVGRRVVLQLSLIHI